MYREVERPEIHLLLAGILESRHTLFYLTHTKEVIVTDKKLDKLTGVFAHLNNVILQLLMELKHSKKWDMKDPDFLIRRKSLEFCIADFMTTVFDGYDGKEVIKLIEKHNETIAKNLKDFMDITDGIDISEDVLNLLNSSKMGYKA